jgi:WXG100 family type VII secretion target
MPENQNDSIQVSLEQLLAASMSFYGESESVLQTQSSLRGPTNALLDEMSGILSLSSDALYLLQLRWNEALNSLHNSLQTMSSNLKQASINYQGIDQQAGQSLSPKGP